MIDLAQYTGVAAVISAVVTIKKCESIKDVINVTWDSIEE